MMNRGENSDSIPTDLILEILLRLPAKSVARFRWVSKLWWSMLSRPYFNDMFLTKSSACPRLLFAVKGQGEWLFFSSPQHPNGKSSLVVAADFHFKFSEDRKFSEYRKIYNCSYASGLIHFEMDKDAVSATAICNPSTGQYAMLPELRTGKGSRSFLGFDPIDKQFKVLMMTDTVYSKAVHHILTLGTDKGSWRKIQCPFTHSPLWRIGKCINGVLYYLAVHFHRSGDRRSFVIVCFDVRSEKFKFIDLKGFPRGSGSEDKMISYKGKFCVIGLKNNPYSRIRIRNLCMWVLEDVEKHEWSKYVYTLPEHEVVDHFNISILGVTSTGEIVLSNFYTSKPFYVFYFNPERNTLQSVEMHCNHEVVENRRCVYAIADHVEDLKFNII